MRGVFERGTVHVQTATNSLFLRSTLPQCLDHAGTKSFLWLPRRCARRSLFLRLYHIGIFLSPLSTSSNVLQVKMCIINQVTFFCKHKYHRRTDFCANSKNRTVCREGGYGHMNSSKPCPRCEKLRMEAEEKEKGCKRHGSVRGRKKVEAAK